MGFDFNAKVFQLSCFWDLLMGKSCVNRENLSEALMVLI